MKKFLILVLVSLLPILAFSQSRSASFIKMISSGTYHMKAKMVGGGMETTMETWVKGNNAATLMEGNGQRTRMIVRDNKLHIIDDTAKTIMVIPSSPDQKKEPVQIDGKMTGTGTAVFNGRNLYYEEYTSENYSDYEYDDYEDDEEYDDEDSDFEDMDAESSKAWWFFDGTKLVGIRNFTSMGNIDIIVLALDQSVPADVFNLPTGYKTQSF